MPDPGTRASRDEFVTLGRLQLSRPLASQRDLRPPCQRNARQTKGEANPTGCVWDRLVQGAQPGGIQGIRDQHTHKGEEADEADDERCPSFAVDGLPIRREASAGVADLHHVKDASTNARSSSSPNPLSTLQ